LEVLDTGSGISEEEVQSLFQKFVQTTSGKDSNQGTGLGLAIAKGFSELMGGSIDVISRIGVGTLFTVVIPVEEVVKAEPKEDEAVPEEKAKPGSELRSVLAQIPPGMKVLVAEDQPVNRQLLRSVLAKTKCVLEEAVNGKLAVEKWRTFRPDIIFMDESMPEMNGTEAARLIIEEAEGNSPAIVSLTAFAMQEQRDAAMAAGCCDFLSKPFKHADIYQLMAKYAPKGDDDRMAA
ncbi:MAG: response regulator, partial [Verrucomicrobiota bacterium]